VSASRTEHPTPRRLREARRRGEVAVSRELSGAAALWGGLAALALSGPAIAAQLAHLLASALAGAGSGAPEPAAVLAEAGAAVLRLALPVCGGALLSGAAAGLLQAGGGLFPEAMRPRLERLDPLRGARRLFSPSQLAAAALGLAKGAVLVGLLWGWFRGVAPALSALPRAGAAGLWRALPLFGSVAVRLAMAFAAFGLLDLALVRRRHRKALMMTRDEVRREQKEDEGDPAHRAERRRRHRALLEAGPISRATVVVVNPTHVAVALRHHRDEGDAPRVVAKGTGLAAARIRSAARRAGVPVVRDVPLARALHRLAEVGDEIPEELYEAAAAVLVHLYGLEERTP
jgi:type III secretion protein U